MTRRCFRMSVLGLVIVMTAVCAAARDVYTGSIVSFGSGTGGRLVTGTFNLTIDRVTSDERSQTLLGLLQEGSEQQLMRELDRETVGRFSVNGRIGPQLNVVRESMVDGRKRIFAVFRRWMGFGELRAGARSTDYPYG